MTRIVVIILRAMNIAALFGPTVSHQFFQPVYTSEIGGLQLPHENSVYVYLGPSSTKSSCIILCGLTPGCLWINFIGGGRCVISDVLCPGPPEQQDATPLDFIMNGVNIFAGSWLDRHWNIIHVDQMCQRNTKITPLTGVKLAYNGTRW